MTVGVYAGSFDPVTYGHTWMVQRGIELFRDFVIAVGVNPDKRPMFDVRERIDMIEDSLPLGVDKRHVSVTSFENQYLIDFARSVGATHVIRGIRGTSDVGFEKTMRNINADMAPDITTVFLMPPRELCEVSSSMVKGLVGPEGWEDIVSRYVPRGVLDRLVAQRRG